MRRQKNIYTVVDDVAQLLCVNEKGESYAAIFPAEFYSEIRQCQWAYKGKNGIVDSFDSTLASLLANRYGYRESNWKRIESNEDFFPRNYTLRSVQSSGFIPTNDNELLAVYKDSYFPRMKWKSKYTCEVLELTVLRGNHPTKMKVKILINTYLRHFVPKYCIIRQKPRLPVDIVCPGTELPLRMKIMQEILNVEDDALESYRHDTWHRENHLDFRVDPNDNTFISTNQTTIRKHRTEDGVILELREKPDVTCNFGWNHGNTKPQYCVPNISTKYMPRTSFVLVDDRVADCIVNMWYNSSGHEFMVDDIISKRPRALKYLVCDVHGYQYNNVYFAPELTTRYAKLLSAKDNYRAMSSATRIENSASTDEYKMKMFTEPKYIRKVRLSFRTTFFNTTIYGGVGIHCLDARFDSMYLPAHLKPNTDPTQRKDTRGTGSLLQDGSIATEPSIAAAREDAEANRQGIR
jgi:hypothetical protein